MRNALGNLYRIRTKPLCFQMLEKFAEDDRIEQMNAQKRRMRQLEHKRAVERLIEERRLQNQRDRVFITTHLNY